MGQRRIDVSWTSSSDYAYKIIRIFRNLPNIKSEWGGDHFYFEDDVRKARKPFTTHNLPPEFDSTINMYHHSRAMPKTALMKGITHSEFYAINHSSRKQVLEREKERVKKRPELLTRKFYIDETNPNIPELFYGLLNLVDYQARPELFNYEWLKR